MQGIASWVVVLLLWVAFAGSHLILSSDPVRSTIVVRLGQQRFLGLYSLVALATFIPLVATYLGHRHEGLLLWDPLALPGARYATIALGTFALALLVASFAQPSPVGMDPRARPQAFGTTRITRHPLLCAFVVWGVAHLLVNGFASDAAFFGGFVVFPLIGARHQDARKFTERGGEILPFFAETSILPFAAILAGRGRFVAAELPWPALLGGACVGLVIYQLHPWIFGP